MTDQRSPEWPGSFLCIVNCRFPYDLCRHDVGMQVVGQPARDLCRHFVQRSVTLCGL